MKLAGYETEKRKEHANQNMKGSYKSLWEMQESYAQLQNQHRC